MYNITSLLKPDEQIYTGENVLMHNEEGTVNCDILIY